METKKALLIIVLLFFISLIPVILIIKAKNDQNKMTTSTTTKEPLRNPAVAGSFYPDDPSELNKLVSGFLNKTKEIPAEGRLKILILPHAGLSFSGQTAAWGFKQIAGKDFSSVIILGVSHRSWFDQAALYSRGTWKTPLGEVTVDENLADKLLDKNKKIITEFDPHLEEHSLEVELVFLQKVLKNFKIMPILVSQVSEALSESLAEKLSQNLDEKTLLVVSSDLSHYPSGTVANEVDNETIKAIISGEKETFEKTLGNLESKGYAGLDTCACGQSAISIALRVAEILKIKDFKKIYYEHSGDVSGDKSRVVGYAAIGAWGEEEKKENLLDEEAKKEALNIARKTLESYLSQRKIPDLAPQSKSLQQHLGAFVTLRRNHELRGCIGRFEPDEPLYKVVQAMAIEAATNDPRFLPVVKEELKDIKIEISVMTPKRRIDDWKKIELGKHGVVIQKGIRSGTFLPQVATETGWNKEEFLSQLCSQKVGLPSNCYKDSSVDLYVFEAEVFAEE